MTAIQPQPRFSNSSATAPAASPRTISHNPAGKYHQQGAFAIILAGTLVALALLLALVVDSGRLYMEKRSLQRVADMTALEVVSRRGSCLDPDAADFATTLAQQAATRNNLFNNGGELVSVQCVDLKTDEHGVREVNAINNNSSTIQVTVARTTPASLVVRAGCLFQTCESDIRLQASAVAGSEEPIAAFSVGSRLIGFDNASTLGGLLGTIGLDLGATDLLSYNGLANVNITPAGLLEQLGLPVDAGLTVGELNGLLIAEQVRVSEILDAAVTVAGKSDLLAANMQLLEQLSLAAGVQSLDVDIPLLTQDDGTPGLFAHIVAPAAQSANSALAAQISTLSIIETALGIAAHEHALSVEHLDTNLLGLIEVKTKVGVVEPPSIVIGGIGATAYTAQIRAYIHLQTGDTIGAINNLVSLLGINLIDINLPIALDLVAGKGVLEENTCTPFAAQQTGNTDRDHAEIAVSGDVAKLCIGKPIDESNLFSKHESCEAYVEGGKHLDILGLVTLDRTNGPPLTLDVLSLPEPKRPEGYVYLSMDEEPLPESWENMTGRADFDTVGTNPLAVGMLVEDLLGLLLSPSVSTVKYDSSQNQRIAEEIWANAQPAGPCEYTECRRAKMASIQEAAASPDNGLLGGVVSGLLNVVVNLLDDVLDAVLNLVGTQIGNDCTVDGFLLWNKVAPTNDQACIRDITNSLPTNSTDNTNLGLGILTELLNALGSEILSPILGDLLGLRVGEVDVHLQDLTCGHAKLMR